MNFADKLDRIFADAGPEGWLNWLSGLRNTLVHRGRRVTTINSSIERAGPGRARIVTTRLLPAAPGLTEVEAWTADGGFLGSLLSEPAETTLESCIHTTANAVDQGCAVLLALWRERRDNPHLGIQPASQYSPPSAAAGERFVGFSPSAAFQTKPSSLGTADESLRRLRAAGLT